MEKKPYLIFLAMLPICIAGFAQRSTIKSITKSDLLCRKQQVAPADTTPRLAYLRFHPLPSLYAKRDSLSPHFNPKVLSWPKYNPNNEKFYKLQLINIIGTHLSR